MKCLAGRKVFTSVGKGRLRYLVMPGMGTIGYRMEVCQWWSGIGLLGEHQRLNELWDRIEKRTGNNMIVGGCMLSGMGDNLKIRRVV